MSRARGRFSPVVEHQVNLQSVLFWRGEMSFSLYSSAQGYTLTSMEMPRSAE